MCSLSASCVASTETFFLPETRARHATKNAINFQQFCLLTGYDINLSLAHPKPPKSWIYLHAAQNEVKLTMRFFFTFSVSNL